jgi:YVTN family beta-propeller protein
LPYKRPVSSYNDFVAKFQHGANPFGVAVTPDGSGVYVANAGNNTVSVIATATNTVVAVLPVRGPGARFAGTPGDANCHGESISALAQTFGGLNAAAIALGFPTVLGLQTSVNTYCGQGAYLLQPE